VTRHALVLLQLLYYSLYKIGKKTYYALLGVSLLSDFSYVQVSQNFGKSYYVTHMHGFFIFFFSWLARQHEINQHEATFEAHKRSFVHMCKFFVSRRGP